MKNEPNFFTDLACERYRADTDIKGVSYNKETTPAGVWERIEISSVEGAKSIGRPIGTYNTLNLGKMEMIDEGCIADAKKEIACELKSIFKNMNILPRRLLIVGLGNPQLTADTVGCASAALIRPTMHVKAIDESFFSTLECSEIAVISPNVPSLTGLESAVSVSGVCDRIKPNAVIAIDSIASSSAERLGSTIQISNTGILPGGGLGNHSSAINESSVGVPVIAVGVPTVISSAAFCLDFCSDSKELNRAMLRKGMYVSPKEINEIVSVSAKIIGGAINLAFGLYS